MMSLPAVLTLQGASYLSIVQSLVLHHIHLQTWTHSQRRLISTPPLFHVRLLAGYIPPTMAPLRRYLRITKYSVLECRIYLDNPALAQSWLLNPRDPILPRVIDSVRPLVLPKLREERERSRKKSTKKRGIKDTVTEGALLRPLPTSPSHSVITRFETHFEYFPCWVWEWSHICARPSEYSRLFLCA